MDSKKGQMPITEVIAIIIAIVVLVVGVVIVVYFKNGGYNIGNELFKVLSFSWLFGGA